MHQSPSFNRSPLPWRTGSDGHQSPIPWSQVAEDELLALAGDPGEMGARLRAARTCAWSEVKEPRKNALDRLILLVEQEAKVSGQQKTAEKDLRDLRAIRQRVEETGFEVLPFAEEGVDGDLKQVKAHLEVVLGKIERPADGEGQAPPGGSQIPAAWEEENQAPRLERVYLEKLVEIQHRERRWALCLSGGGIRSATFALGLVQGLAQQGVLRRFHYLSTVSGGGFLGGWLSAWMHRETPEKVQAALKDQAPTWTNDSHDCPHGPEPCPEAPPIAWLRAHSRYLSPRLGLLSLDTWALVATLLRNASLHLLVFLPLLAALCLVPRAILGGRGALGSSLIVSQAISIGLVLIALSVAIAYQRRGERESVDARSRRLPYFLSALLLSALCFFGLSLGLGPPGERFAFLPWLPLGVFTVGTTSLMVGVIHQPMNARRLGIIGIAALAAGTVAAWFSLAHGSFLPLLTAYTLLFGYLFLLLAFGWPRHRVGATLTLVGISGALMGIFIWLFHRVGSIWPKTPVADETAVVVGPMLVLAGFLAVWHPFLALGRRLHLLQDLHQEWYARLTGLLMLVTTGWAVLCGISLWAGALWALLLDLPRFFLGLAGVSLVTVVWSTLSSDTRGQRNGRLPAWKSWLLDRAAPLGGTALILLLFIGMSMGLEVLLKRPPVDRMVGLLGAGGPALGLLVTILLLAGIGCLLALLLPLNHFSLHGLYRNRLIRAYLGASHRNRHPMAFTGFDPGDNLPLHALRPEPGGAPLLVVNIALNLTTGENLAWQDRAAESFTASPLHCGSRYEGFRLTDLYGSSRGLTLGEAITLSGAAANPNMGYHSSTPLAFLLSLLALGLGAWKGNPGLPGSTWGAWKQGSPRFFLKPLLASALGRAGRQHPYVNLSDGGHFENLGLYEMVARRCSVIVVSDASADPIYGHADLAGSLQRIRVDLGIPIEFTQGLVWEKGVGREAYRSRRPPLALGTIRYDHVDGPDAPKGLLVVVKAALTGDEPVDVRAYTKGHPDFPHEGTSDQFFSEAQFESYRVLGQHRVAPLVKLLPEVGGSAHA